ncbi:hypothetical protein HY004_00680 [Candidatus Saccharibacteria bacterium]|nr:hypothetical protein [Candidatus Saccharibacteria bacterium]
MTQKTSLMRVRLLSKWSKVALAFLVLLGAGVVILYLNSLSPRTTNDSAATNGTYKPLQSFGAAYTVTRTYTSRSNVVINNLWKHTQKIVGGLGFACALSNGKVYCWGLNDSGQLGDNSTTNRSSPTPVYVGTSGSPGALYGRYVTDIAAGGGHVCVIADGGVFCWGYNGSGRLGDGTQTTRLAPVVVPSLAPSQAYNATRITAGGYHTCAIAQATAYCWGRNGEGQLGNGSSSNANSPFNPNQGQPASDAYYSATPVTVTDSTYLATEISAGSNHTCAVIDSRAYCWGGTSNTASGGRLGNGVSGNGTNSIYRQVVRANSGDALYQKLVTSVSAGASQSCAIAEGKAYCWGYNAVGEVGDGTTTTRSVPVAVSTSGSSALPSTAVVTSIAMGIFTGGPSEYTTCAVATGKAYCWGKNNQGQLGNGTNTDSAFPVAVSAGGVFSGKNVTSVMPGSPFTCSIANGRAYCWGDNSYGQLGNGTTTDTNIPYRVNDSYYTE